MKALILVGGFGTRLRPLTLSCPKPLVPFANKPTVVHQIEALKRVGVDEVVLAIAYQPKAMREAMDVWEKELGIRIVYSQETEPLGTAGPIALAREHLDDGEEFFVLNSDVICEFPLEDILAFHRERGAEATIFVTKVEEPSKFGVVVTKDDGQVVRFVEKPKEYVGNRINAGIYVLSNSVLNRIEPKPTSIEKEIFPAIASDGMMYAYDLVGFWQDVGQPRDFISGTAMYLNHVDEVSPELLTRGSGFVGRVLTHSSVSIGKDCLIGPNVVIGSNCVIEDGVRLCNCILFDGVKIGKASWIKNAIIGWESSVGKWVRIEGTSVLGEDVNVKDELYINGGKVLPHKSISESIAEPAIIM